MFAGRGEDDAGHAGVRNPQGFPPEPHHSRLLYTYCVYLALSNSDSFPASRFAAGNQKFHQLLCVILFAGEVRESGERVGFEVVTLDGRSGPLASSKVSRSVSLLVCYFWFHLLSIVHLGKGNWDFEMCQYYGNYLMMWSCRLLIQAVKHDRSYCIAMYLDK